QNPKTPKPQNPKENGKVKGLGSLSDHELIGFLNCCQLVLDYLVELCGAVGYLAEGGLGLLHDETDASELFCALVLGTDAELEVCCYPLYLGLQLRDLGRVLCRIILQRVSVSLQVQNLCRQRPDRIPARVVHNRSALLKFNYYCELSV
ncbi:MAG: hypothetical protein P4M11_08440, partial [Candidatus Pacebacteria bacterium]|nr:hypothetical protein [Candidatus Paceibacterota bacterium]